jgi:hypothetical protein
MRNFYLLLLLAGLGTVGYLNRDAIMTRFGSPPAEKQAAEEPEAPVVKKPTATPHPATDSRAAAVRAFPALGQKDSIFNKTFLVLHSQAEQNEPDLLAKPDWPMVLAKRTSASLTPATPVPTPRPPPPTPFKPLHDSALDMHPSGGKGGPTAH